MRFRLLLILRYLLFFILFICISIVAYYEKVLESTNSTIVFLSIITILFFFFVELSYNKLLKKQKRELVFGKKMKINLYSVVSFVITLNFLVRLVIDYYRNEPFGFWLLLSATFFVLSILRMDCYPVRLNRKKITKDELVSISTKKITSLEIINDEIVITSFDKKLTIDYKKLGLENPYIIIEEIERLKNN